MRLVIAKRKPFPRWARIALPFLAVAVTLLIAAIPILAAGADLGAAYAALFRGAFGSRYNFLETLVKAVPYTFTGLAVAFAFRAKFWNIGAEGQLYAGAIVATVVGLRMGSVPSFLAIPAVLISGMAAGGLWAALPVFLKTKLKVDDVVSSLLLNYVMLHIMGALLFGPLQEAGSGWPKSAEIAKSAWLPILLPRSRFHLGIIIAAAAVLVLWFVNEKTVFGYRSRAVGVNARAAAFGGIAVNRVLFVTALVSGGLAGLAGASELCAIQYRLLMDISPGYGYSGIVIAMLGALHPVGVLFSALFFSAVHTGAQTMSRMTGVPSYITEVIQGSALIVMLVFLLISEYSVRLERKK